MVQTGTASPDMQRFFSDCFISLSAHPVSSWHHKIYDAWRLPRFIHRHNQTNICKIFSTSHHHFSIIIFTLSCHWHPMFQ